jgi:hypothetical protein
MLIQGKGFELLGVVSASKLRTIQSFLAFDQSGKMFKEMREMNEKLDNMTQAVMSIKAIAEDFQGALSISGKVLADSMVRIANIAEQAMNPKFFTR